MTGIDAKRLADATALAQRSEIDWPRDLDQALQRGVLDAPPYNVALGPTQPRGGPNGVVMRRGRLIGSWGDPHLADFTFSVAKSFLALLAGVALKEGLIRDINDPVRDYAIDTDFESEQNRTITWHHLLQQTSEWEGTLFGLPDLVDRHRDVGSDGDNALKGTHRVLQAPGAFWEYNDVRVNRLSLSLTQLFRQPLPEVLNERLMRPLNASENWRWRGYYNADVEIDGRTMTSVPGGTHWGGGLCISAMDQALIGELVRLRGTVDGQQLLPDEWCQSLFTPCALKPDYGYLWWLNTGREMVQSVSEGSVFAMGAGGNHIWVDVDLELVVVARWLDPAQVDNVFGAVVDALD